MTWSKAASYGLLAVYEIARRHRGAAAPSGVQAHDIAKKYKLPLAYAAKVMGQLAHAGILQSVRGPHGGFKLNRAADNISLWDVLEAVDEFGAEGRKATPGYPPSVQAMLGKAFKEGQAQLREAYRKYTVVDLI